MKQKATVPRMKANNAPFQNLSSVCRSLLFRDSQCAGRKCTQHCQNLNSCRPPGVRKG
jgi:hypothetical protein